MMRFFFQEDEGVLMIFLWDNLILGLFLLIGSSLSQLLSHSCLGDLEHVSLVHSFKGDSAVQLSRSPVNLGINCFQEGVSEQDFIAIYFRHKELVFLPIVLSAYF